MLRLLPLLLVLTLAFAAGCADDDLVIQPRNPGASIERIEAALPPDQARAFHEALELVLRRHQPDSLYAAIDATADPALFAPVYGMTPDEVVALADSLRRAGAAPAPATPRP